MAGAQSKSDAAHQRRHRILRIAAISAAVLLLLVVAGLFALHSSPGRRFVLSQVTTLLAAQQIELTTDELRYNLFKLSLNVRNVRVRSPQMPEPPFATIANARVDLSLLQLIRGRYVVQSGVVDGLQVHYVVDQNGVDNMPRTPKKPDQPSEPLDYLIGRLAIANGNVRYEDRARQIDLTLPVTSIAVNGNSLTDRHDVSLETSAGDLRMEARRVRIDRITGTLDLGREDVTIERLDADVEGSHLALSGGIREFESPQGDLNLEATIDAARAAALAGVDDTVDGVVDIAATARGPLASPAIEAHVKGRELAFRNLSSVRVDATAAYDIASKRAHVSSLQIESSWGRVSGDALVALEPSEESRLHANVSAVDAATLMRALELPYVAATRVDARVDARWPGIEYLEASGAAVATLTPTAAAPSRSVIPVGGRIDANGRVGQLDLHLQNVRVAGAIVDGRLALANRQDLSGALRARIPDVATTVHSAEAILARRRGELAPTPITGPLLIDTKLGGTLSRPMLAANFSAPALAIGRATDIRIGGDVTYTAAELTVDQVDLAWQNARAHAAGRIELTGRQRLDLTLSADALEVPELLRAADQTGIPASGTISLQGTIGGTTSQPAATIALQGRELTTYEELLGSLSASLTLANRELRLTELLLDKPQPNGNGQLKASGTYQLDRRTYTLDLSSDRLQLTSARLPDGRAIRGNVRLNGRGQGTVASPAANVNLTVDGLRFDTYDLGRLVVNAALAEQQANVTATAEQFALDANARIGVRSPYPATATFRFDNLELSNLPMKLATPLEGQLQATIEATADLATPTQGRATGQIAAFSGSWNGRPFSVEGPAIFRYAAERLAIDQLKVVAQDSTLLVRGDLPLTDRTPPGAIQVEADANLATLAQYAPAGTNVSGEGAVKLTGTIRGTLNAIDPDLVITIDNGLILSPQLEPGISNLLLRARVAGGEATIEQLSANWGAATLTASGRVPLEVLPALPVDMPRQGGPTTFNAAVRGLDPAAVPGAPPGLSGRISLDAQVAAARADLAALEGRIAFPELQVSFDNLTLAQQQPSAVSISGGTATIEQFALSGSIGTLAGAGSIELVDDRALDVSVNGDLNIAAISAFTDAVRAEGKTTLQIAARGTLAEPELSGAVDLSEATLVVDEPSVAVEGLTARVDISGQRLTLTSLTGTLNGGTLKGSGTVARGDDGLPDVDLHLSTTDVAFDAPLELQSLSDASIRITRRDDELIIDGDVTIDEAGLTEDINFDTGLFAAISTPRKLDFTRERNPLLERVRFNINVDTAAPVVVDNNLARAEITADLTVLGSPYETGLSGRLTLLPESEITLNERRYAVEHGAIRFLDERRIVPSVDLLLNTSVSNYDVSVGVTGTLEDTETTLTSDPTLPEPDIMALLVTGRTLDDMRGEEFEVAREQVLSYLAGRVGSSLGRGLERATGLSEVRIEPNLIANEADPSARLTVAQEITDQLGLVYSTKLTDSNDQIWMAEYDVTRRFQTRVVRQSDNTYRLDFRHDVRFGGRPAPRRMARQRAKVAALSVSGASGLSEDELRKLLDVEVGDQYDFFATRAGVQRIEERFRERGWLQSRVRLERTVDGQSVKLTLKVSSGPQVDVQFAGFMPPAKVQDEVRLLWHRGVFDGQRVDDGVETLSAWLMQNRYLQPKVDASISEAAADRRRVVFNIAPGPRFDTLRLAFEGASGISGRELDDIIEQQDLEQKLFTDPLVVTELLQRYYREQGYLTAEIDEPRYEYEGTLARVVLAVREGPRFSIRRVSSAGNAVIATPLLLPELPVVVGDPFLPFAMENAVQRIRDLYWRLGYNDVRADYELVVDRLEGQVDVAFTVEEGRQSVIAAIEIEGNQKTSEHLVREQLELNPEQPLDLSALSRSRKNLYDTGAFSVVDLTREELVGDAPASQEAGDTQAATNGEEKPVRVNVAVREVQPLQLRYGASYDTERGIGGIFDISNHNSLGKARVVGLQARYDGGVHEARTYISQPNLRYFPVQLTGSVYYRDERNPVTDVTGAFNVDRRGLSLIGETELGNSYVWNYGYRYEKARTFDPAPGGLLDETVTVAPLTSTFTRDARDEVLDASTGSFTAHAFEYSPAWLGSDLPYLKYLAQYFHYFPLRAPQRERFTNEILKPRFVFATGVRIGLAKGIGGGVLPISERFFAGGSTSLRGFQQNAVGPIGADFLPAGGNALFVINNELRFPLVSIVDGVVFADVGNVFPKVSDFSFSDLRESGGVGIRLRTPWFLIRGDYGVVLDRRPGERRSRFYFSIGQAF